MAGPTPGAHTTDEATFSGGGGIRTRGPLARTLVFKTSAFDHSATPPVAVASDANALRRNVETRPRESPIKLYTPAEHPGEVAEWLKALAC